MSSSRRPWFPWYPSDFNQDEKVRMLSDDAELLYRRALDVLWQANDLQLPSNCQKLAKALARGWSQERFENAWADIQTPGFELLKTTDDGQWVYSKRLKIEADKYLNISERRKIIGKSGGLAKAKQKLSNCQPKHIANGKQSVTQPQPQPHINNTPLTPQGGKPAYSEAFETFWSVCPKKVGKDAAYRSWQKIGKRKGASPTQIVNAMVAQIKANHFRGNDGQDYLPNPATWLNQGRWQDEIKQQPQDIIPSIGKRLA